jgi:hypothetical protein
VVGALHHRYVDGHAGAGGEGFLLQAQEIEVLAVVLEGAAAGLTTTGARRSNTASIALGLNRSMPLFQVKRLLARNC